MLDDDGPPPICPFHLDDEFDSKALLVNACRTWAIKLPFEFNTIRSNKTRYEIACKEEGCHWRLYATSVAGAGHIFRIKTFNVDHNCMGITSTRHQQASAQFLAEWILPKVKQNTRYKPKAIMEDVKAHLHIHITKSKAFRAKERALELIYGSYEDAYKAMPKYAADIEKTNPNSIAVVEATPDNRFRRAFISFGASTTGFAHCRPLLGIDGTHLKTRYKGILLTATGIDAHGQLFPIAFAAVDAENDDNWMWMLQLLHRLILQSAPHFLTPNVYPFTPIFL